jgi:DNA-binding transcriptional ArsR family regulator
MGIDTPRGSAANSAGGLARTFALLADEFRLHIVLALSYHGEQVVSALAQTCGRSPPVTSRHLALLRLGGLVEKRRQGRWNYYRLRQEVFMELRDGIFRSLTKPGHRSPLRSAK